MEAVPAAPAAEVKQEPAPGAQPPAAATETPAEPKVEKTFTQAELDEIVEKRLAKERRKREEIKREADVLRKLALERNDRPAEPKAPPAGDREPVRSDFDTYEDFIQARAEYRAGKTAETVLKKDREESERKAKEAEANKARESFRAKLKESAKDIEDFDEVMQSITTESPVANVWAGAVEASDNPGKMLYHLTTHPEEAERIASLPMGMQAREIVKLDAILATKPTAKPSKAPAPINPVGGAKTTVQGEMPDPSDTDAWMKWRNQQVRLKRTGKAA